MNAYQNKSKSKIKAYKEAVKYWDELKTELRAKSKDLYWEWRKK